MKEWTGKVTEIKDVPWQDIHLFSFKIDQSQRLFKLGRNKPTFKEGEWVKFNERNGNVELSSIETGVEPQVSDTYIEPTDNQESSTSATPVGDVGLRLQYQAARADAARIVVAALHTDHLPHASNVAKGKRLDLLQGYVEQVTQALLKQEERNVKK